MMMRWRAVQIGLAVCFLASLLTAAPAACICSHFEADEPLVECHSHYDSDEAGVSGDVDALNASCVCAIDEQTPSMAPRPGGEELTVKHAAEPSAFVTEIRFVAGRSVGLPPAGQSRQPLYSNTLRSLLPARAPPRL